LYFNPHDQDDLLSKMDSIISDKLLRDLLVEKGYKQIEKYSWEKMTNEILAIYGSK
jgi:glycosyltransferase involved in cell wall biosynthesis